jgi:hypothetical protein
MTGELHVAKINEIIKKDQYELNDRILSNYSLKIKEIFINYVVLCWFDENIVVAGVMRHAQIVSKKDVMRGLKIGSRCIFSNLTLTDSSLRPE